jgi:hypothetical protein
MSLKKERFIKGIILAPDTLSLDGIEGEIKVDSSTGKIQVTLKDGANPSASREILTSSQTQTLTNKTLTSPVIDTGVSGSAIDIDGTLAANSDTKLASQKAVKTYVDAQIGSKDEADEIIYDNTTSGLVATNVQTAIDEVDGNVDNLVTLSGVALDSTTLGTFTGTTIPDSSTIKSAIQSLETSHESHTGASSGVHGVAGSVVGTSDSQALTNKTIDADLNTISNIENADIKVGANIARSKLASGTANRVVVNDATGVQTDAAAITAARVLISDANGIPTHSSVTSTTLSYVDATSSIQNQLDAKVDESGGTLTNGSVITPARLDVKQDTKANLTTYALTAANGQLCFATDTKEMFQIVDGLLESVGGGAGIGGVDILFSQTFEEAALTDFTQTGLSLSTSSPLHGEISALLTHDSSINQLFKQIIPVDIKFRGQTMVLRLDSKSSASQGNVVINIYDETNSANLVASEQLQLSNDVNGKRTSVSFTIPETCASLSYTITALPEAGSPTTRIDDIICELAEIALLETAVEVPVVTAWQGYTPTFQGFGSPTNIEFEYRQVGENVEIRGKFTSGTSTAVEARVGLPAGLTSASTSLIPSIKEIGVGSFGNTTASQAIILIEPSVSYLTIGLQSSTGSGLSKINGSTLLSSSQQLSFFASVPCSGLSATTTKTIPLTQSGLVQEGDATLRMSTPVRGSTNTSVYNFSSTVESVGNLDILVTPSATLGSTFTVLKDGVYSISFSTLTQGVATSIVCAITKNAVALTTNPNAYSADILLAYDRDTDAAGGSTKFANAAWTGRLVSGDIIRLQGDPGDATIDVDSSVTITKQGSLKQVSVNPNSKITIPTSELRFEGASARGSTATAIVRFDTMAKLRGGAFTVESDAVLGTRITMKKAGKLNISASLTANISTTYLSLNQSVLTAVPSAAAQIIAAQSIDSNGNLCSLSSELDVNEGDVIRVACSQAPSANVGNSLNLSFQEQDISVSVTNTLPQFSESDSSVRVDTANGYGSTANKIRRFSNVRDSLGSDIQYNPNSDEATNGASFRVMSSGIYNISYTEQASGASYFGVSKNSSQLTTAIVSINTADRLCVGTVDSISGYPETVSWQGYLIAGDIIRPHTEGTAASAAPDRTQFTISKVGKPNVTGVDVTPFVNVPQPQLGFISASGGSLSGNGIVSNFGSFVNSTNGIVSQTSSRIIALKRCVISLNASGVTAASGVILHGYKNGAFFTYGSNAYTTTATSVLPINTTLEAGEYLEIYVSNSATNTTLIQYQAVIEALSDQILTAPETFSTDTASLKYAGSASYTLSTLQNAPVGTFITFTYAANTNTRTQTVNTAPTQFASGSGDANANGIQIFTRAFNATSTAASPAAIAIQIGKGLKGKSLDLYKSAGKVTSGAIDNVVVSASLERGLFLKEYDEKTGILFVDAGLKHAGTNTSHEFTFSDGLAQTSGYLVINASKNVSLTGMNVERVSVRAVNSAGTSISTSGTEVPWDSVKTFDTHGALNTSTGVFTAPESGYYQVNCYLSFANDTYVVNGDVQIVGRKNGVAYSSTRDRMNAATTLTTQVGYSDIVYLAKNDTFSITAANSSGPTALQASGTENFLSIAKVNIGGKS